MTSMISNIWRKARVAGVGMSLLLVGCGTVAKPEPPEPPAQTQPTQNQVTSAAGVARGARFTMRVQVGHAYAQHAAQGARVRVGTASPLANEPRSTESE